MAKVSLSQAAKDTGVSLPTLSRWRAAGKFSADKQQSGGYLVDTSEYDRINTLKEQSPSMKPKSIDFMEVGATPNEMKELLVEVEVLREKEKLKDTRIHELQQTVSEIKVERDDWKEQAQTLLLTADIKPSEAPEIFPEAHPPAMQENAPQGQKIVKFAAVCLVLVGLGAGALLFQNEIKKVAQNQGWIEVAEEKAEELNKIAPAAGGEKKEKAATKPRFYNNKAFTPIPEYQDFRE